VTLLEIEDLDAGYGELQILDSVDMTVGDGEYVTIVGPNGAGKSTAMKAICNIATVMGGSVQFNGMDITAMKQSEIIRHGLAYVPQNENVFSTMTVRENLEIGAYILDDIHQERFDAVYERFPILEERTDQKVGTMSGGQRQMVAMGQALMLDPQMLLLDEPSAGLAPSLVDEMFDRIDQINDSGTSILMVEQNAKEALRRCDRGYVLAQGQNHHEGPGRELLADEQVRRDFLGG
jgi:branched-chain amino acid transport system ATP-binding protein